MSKTTRGFTIPEVLTVVAIIAILGAIAVVGYQEYTARARAADIVLKYDAIKTSVQARVAKQKSDDCAELAKGFDSANLANQYATLAYGFEAASGGGYRPVLTVCGKSDAGNPAGAKIAKGAHDTMVKTGSVEKGAVITDTVVSFALTLSSGSQAMCQKWVAPAATTACGAAPAAQTTGVTPPQPVASAGTGSAVNPVLASALAQAKSPEQLQHAVAQATTAVDLAQVITQVSDPAVLALVIAQAQKLPSDQLTGAIPTSRAAAQHLQSCNIRFTGGCVDRVSGGCTSEQIQGASTNCVAAMLCPKSGGLCAGVPPEVQRALDASWRDARRAAQTP